MAQKKWNRAQFQANNDHRWKAIAGTLCVYCGDRAVLLDHVPSLYAVYKGDAWPYCKVPSCWACNSALGADTPIGLADRVGVIAASLSGSESDDQRLVFAELVSRVDLVGPEGWATACGVCDNRLEAMSVALDLCEAAFNAMMKIIDEG